MERDSRRAHFEEERGVWAESGDDLTRVMQFSDGVFAIAATLLALEIRVPVGIPASAPRGTVLVAVVHLLPVVLVYVLTFMNIAVLWISHHRSFSYIQGYDTPLLWMNAFFLMCVAFLPVASSTLGRYPDHYGAVVFYAATLLATTLADLQIWLYATSKRRLVADDIDNRVVRYISLRAVFPAVVFAAAILIAFMSARAAEVMIAGVFFVAIVLGRIYSPALAHLSHPPQKRPLPPEGGRGRSKRGKDAS
jgi:uncharacterized membrane protein